EGPSWEALWKQWCEAGLEPETFWRQTPRTFGLIVGARMKGNFDLATAAGWNAARFDRTKNIKALGEYLKPALTPEEKQATGTAKLQELSARKFREQQRQGDG